MKRIMVFMLVGVLAACLFMTSSAMGTTSDKNSVGKVIPNAPGFTLKDVNGKEVSMHDFKGKNVLIVFGTTWCPYCVTEVNDLKAFFNKHKDKDVKLLSIDIQESQEKVSAFVKKYGINYTVLLDETGDVARSYNVYGIPATYFVDETGIIKYSGSGKPKEGFEALLK